MQEVTGTQQIPAQVCPSSDHVASPRMNPGFRLHSDHAYHCWAVLNPRFIRLQTVPPSTGYAIALRPHLLYNQ